MSYIKSKGDATLADIVRFIKETVRGGVSSEQRTPSLTRDTSCAGIPSMAGSWAFMPRLQGESWPLEHLFAGH